MWQLFLLLWHSFSRLGKTKIHNFFVVGHLSSQLYLHKTLSNSKTILRFYYRKRLLWSFWKKLFMSSKFSSKKIFDQKNILVKKLEQIGIALLKKNEHQKLIKFWWTIILKKKVKSRSIDIHLILYQKSCLKNKNWRQPMWIGCRNSLFPFFQFLFALGLRDGNRRILVCFPPNCNKPHFSPNPFPSFFPSK